MILMYSRFCGVIVFKHWIACIGWIELHWIYHFVSNVTDQVIILCQVYPFYFFPLLYSSKEEENGKIWTLQTGFLWPCQFTKRN